MQTITLVTGNQHKLQEFRRLWTDAIKLEVVDIDLPEIQSFDSREIVADKVKRAYAQVAAPVIVEDVAAGLDALNGLPGPFIKFFEQRLGRDALFQLSGEDKAATVTCTIGYYDGADILFGTGVIHGSVVPQATEEGFGFDACFVPEGQKLTFGEMGPDAKDAISHRFLAVQDLLAQLKQL